MYVCMCVCILYIYIYIHIQQAACSVNIFSLFLSAHEGKKEGKKQITTRKRKKTEEQLKKRLSMSILGQGEEDLE